MEVINLLPTFASEIPKNYSNANSIPNIRIQIFFYGNDHTPIHIHVEKGNAQAKYELFPLSLVYNHGFKVSELRMIEELIEDNKEIITEHWNSFFNNAK